MRSVAPAVGSSRDVQGYVVECVVIDMIRPTLAALYLETAIDSAAGILVEYIAVNIPTGTTCGAGARHDALIIPVSDFAIAEGYVGRVLLGDHVGVAIGVSWGPTHTVPTPIGLDDGIGVLGAP